MIPSAAEADAGPELISLYADIRQTLRTPGLNLIWRHLATVDGALPWVWRHLKPLYLDPTLELYADDLREIALTAARSACLAPWGRTDLSRAGVDADDLAMIHRVLLNYHQTNPGNLVALLSLLGGMSRGTDSITDRNRRRPVAGETSEPASPLPLPTLIDPTTMSPATYALALGLEALGRTSPTERMVAGVPRHLAHWPRFLALVVETLSSANVDLLHTIQLVDAAAARSADEIDLGVGSSSMPTFSPLVVSALERFTSSDWISGYIAKIAFGFANLPEGSRFPDPRIP